MRNYFRFCMLLGIFVFHSFVEHLGLNLCSHSKQKSSVLSWNLKLSLITFLEFVFILPTLNLMFLIDISYKEYLFNLLLTDSKFIYLNLFTFPLKTSKTDCSVDFSTSVSYSIDKVLVEVAKFNRSCINHIESQGFFL